MRTFFAIGSALPVLALAVLLAAPAHADKSVKPAEAVHQGAETAAPKPAKLQTRSAATPSRRVVAQQEAIKALKLVDGDWRGPSKVLRKDGWAELTETTAGSRQKRRPIHAGPSRVPGPPLKRGLVPPSRKG